MDILEIVTKQAVQRATEVALKKGKVAGLKEGALAVACEMKRAGFSLDDIARFTKLPIAELEAI